MERNVDTDNDDQRLCWRCVSDHFLKRKIKAEGKRFDCDFCGGSAARTFPLNRLADLVEVAFENHFERTSPDPSEDEYLLIRHAEDYWWERNGEPVEEVISEIAGVEEEVAEALVEILSDRYSNFDLAAMGEETEFARDSHYRSKAIHHSDRYHEAWAAFERRLQTECRFFSKDAQEILDEVFKDVSEIETRSGMRVVREVGPNTVLEILFRARVFQSDHDLEAALKRPDLEISPPPSSKASAGRMNAQGISVFYGANNPETALAEVRPPVGSQVAIAEFEILRPVRILDIRSLGEILVRESYFEPDSRRLLERAAFLGDLSRKLVRPAMPEREHRDYLVTQVVADYLASELSLDGIIFPSVQTDEGFNVVLFHHASRTEKFDYPDDVEISVGPDGWEEDGDSPDYRVCVTLPETERPSDQEEGGEIDGEWVLSGLRPFQIIEVDPDSRQPTLRLGGGGVTVRVVEGVSYSATTVNVRRTVIHGRTDFSWMV